MGQSLDNRTGGKTFLKGIDYRAFHPSLTSEERFGLAVENGFDGVELAFSAAGALPLDTSDDDLMRLRRLGERVAPICSVNGGRALLETPLTSPHIDEQRAAFHMAKRLIRMTAQVGADTLLTVPGVVLPKVPYDHAYEFCVDVVQQLAEYASEYGIILAVENVWNRFLLSPLEMRQFVDDVGSGTVRVYFDVANTLVLGYPQHWIRILGERIVRVHIKDYRVSVGGTLAGFVQPLEGDVEWPTVVQALVDIGYKGFLTVEIPHYKYCGNEAIVVASRALDALISLRN